MHSDESKSQQENMALIGAKGGAAGKGTEKRRAVAKKAAAARWSRKPRVTGKGPIVRLSSEGPTLTIANFPPALTDLLRTYRPAADESAAGWVWQNNYTINPNGTLSTSLGFFGRIEELLIKSGHSVEYVRMQPPHPKPVFDLSVFRGFSRDEKLMLKLMLGHPGGACAYVDETAATKITTALVNAFPKYRGIVVAPTNKLVLELYRNLKDPIERSGRTVGFLAGKTADNVDIMIDSGDVSIMTDSMISSGIIAPETVGFAVFAGLPKKGEKTVLEMMKFFAATKFGLCWTRPPKWMRFSIEGVFGPFVDNQTSMAGPTFP